MGIAPNTPGLITVFALQLAVFSIILVLNALLIICLVHLVNLDFVKEGKVNHIAIVVLDNDTLCSTFVTSVITLLLSGMSWVMGVDPDVI